jgi:ribose 5-phosphate isomerase A
MMETDITFYKQQAAEKAVEFVKSGMVIGLGEGSTAIYAVHKIGELYSSGTLTDILGISCSIKVEEETRRYGIPLTTLNKHPIVDLTIDGADEVDPQFNSKKSWPRQVNERSSWLTRASCQRNLG